MGWLGRVVASTVVRRLTTLALLALLGYVGIDKAHAHAGSHATRQEAYSECIAAAQLQTSQSIYYNYFCHPNSDTVSAVTQYTSVRTANKTQLAGIYYTSLATSYSYAYGSGTGPYYWAGTGCPADSPGWDDATKACKPSPAQCLAKPARTSGWSKVGGATCHEGCAFANPTSGETFTANGSTYTSLAGSTPTGGACTGDASNTMLPDAPQYCEPVGNLTMCVKQNGEHCATASTGKQICWQPGETGEKTDGPVLQKKVAGTNEIPPSFTLPNGDSLTKTAGPATTSGTKNGTTTTTTTTNYTTVNGTNAGTTNSGEPGDGTGGSGDGTDPNGVTGGGDCEAASKPVPTGDALLGGILVQAWEARCLGTVTSTGDVSNCADTFTVTGPAKSAEVVKLKALRASICTGVPSTEITDGTTGEDAADGNIWQEGDTTAGWLGKLNDTGFLGGSACPAMPVFNLGSFGSYAPDIPYWCDLVAMLAAFVLFSASIAAIVILMGD